MKKRGQVTIFIILAVFIVAATAAIYAFLPQIKSVIGSDVKNPNAFIEECIRDDLQAAVDLASVQGGSLDPEHFVLFRGDRVEYLCYTSDYYKTCTMQQPMLKEHIEDVLGDSIAEKARSCFQELKSSYQSQGYKVTLKEGDSRVELLPKRISMIFNNSLFLEKGENTESYNQIIVYFENNIYELMTIAQSILRSETTLGDTETGTYMTLYRDLKVEKYKQSDDTKIFILTDLNNENKFQFATRGIAWPSGYNL